jgi:hypothetical protein
VVDTVLTVSYDVYMDTETNSIEVTLVEGRGGVGEYHVAGCKAAGAHQCPSGYRLDYLLQKREDIKNDPNYKFHACLNKALKTAGR